MRPIPYLEIVSNNILSRENIGHQALTPLEITSLRGSNSKYILLKVKFLTGLTLLEILISTIIFALVMAGLVNLFITAKRYTRHIRSRIQAAELEKLFLDPLQMQVREDTWNSSCLGANNCTAMPSQETLDGIPYNATYNITNVIGTTLRRARVTLNWNEPPP